MKKPDAIQFADDRPLQLNDDLYQWAYDAEVLIRSMQSRLESLEKDAARYQLRLETIRALYPSAPSDCELDTAIDTAMQARKGGE